MSTDTQFVHMAWQQNEKSLAKVKFQMAADPTGKLSRMFGVYDEATGLALRGTFIINPEGTILNSEVNFYNLGRNVDELIRKLKANLYLSKHDTEGCPAQWRVCDRLGRFRVRCCRALRRARFSAILSFLFLFFAVA